MKTPYAWIGLPTPVNLEEGETECDWLCNHVGETTFAIQSLWDDILNLEEEIYHV